MLTKLSSEIKYTWLIVFTYSTCLFRIVRYVVGLMTRNYIKKVLSYGNAQVETPFTFRHFIFTHSFQTHVTTARTKLATRDTNESAFSTASSRCGRDCGERPPPGNE